MRQVVDEVIHRDAVGHVGPFCRIGRVVGPFPRVAQIHVVADGYFNAAFVVIDALPVRFVAVLFIGAAGAEILRSRNLILVIQIVESMKDPIRFRQIDDLAIRKYLLNTFPDL